MKRFGSSSYLMHPMSENDIFSLRLQLLVIIVKAAMKGYPFGEHRTQSALENASELHKMASRIDMSFLNLDTPAHHFRERVKLLSVMCAAIVDGSYPLGVHRRDAVLKNIKVIETCALLTKQTTLFERVLKVA